MKYALSLEGGGARGAYQIGAVKALMEEGYKFDAIVGTSIGSINAAMLVQGDFDKAYDVWKNIKYSKIFDVDDKKLKKALDIDLNLDVIKYISKKIGETVKNGGIDTEKMYQFLSKYIDEERVRNSDILFGLVTICISDKKAQELYIDQIPKGELLDYIMASSSLPIFKSTKINNKSYLDGGFWDNCPVEMLEKRGFTEVYAIRLHKRMRIRNYKSLVKKGNVNIHMIEPLEELPSIMNFDNKTANELLKLGYYDSLKVVRGLDGIRYYTIFLEEKYFFDRVINFDEKAIKKIASLLKIKIDSNTSLKKLFLEEILSQLVYKTKEKEADTYKNAIYYLVEYVAAKEDIEKYKIYNFEELLVKIKNKIVPKTLSRIDEAIYVFVKNI